MEKKILAYLKDIGLTKELVDRVESLYTSYQSISSEEITDLFITDYLTKERKRIYENLWFFSENYIMEAKQFISQDNLDIAPNKKNIIYFQVEKKDYDLKKASEKSRINLNIRFGAILRGDLKASEKNCDYLWKIVKDHFLPNLE